MKLTINLVLILLLTLTSCKKDEDDRFLGKGECIRQSTKPITGETISEWTGKALVMYSNTIEDRDNCITFVFNKYNNAGGLAEKIYFGNIPLELAKNILSTTFGLEGRKYESSFSSTKSNGEILTGYYTINNEHRDNYLEITEIDEANNLIKGNFQATYTQSYSQDTVWVKDGVFEISFPR